MSISTGSAYANKPGVKSSLENSPKHVAIVMDGNGRWAKTRQLSRTRGHREGMQVVKKVLETCLSLDLPYLTLFAFGQENWKRPSQEVRNLMRLFYIALKKDVRKLKDEGIKLHIIGDRSAFSEALQKAMQEAEALTAHNTRLVLTLAINYSGRWDLMQAIHRLSDKTEVTELSLPTALQQLKLPEPDLLIRTGGVQRLSNFILWELAYTELYFTDILWPDFTPEAFMQALKAYSQRERRFGLTTEQLE